MSIGDTLAEARRQAGLTLAQVSQQTRIRESIIRVDRAGRLLACGGDFYARGHIRSIAAAVGVDPVPLIREYDEEHGPPGAMRASQIFDRPRRSRSASRGTCTSGGCSRWRCSRWRDSAPTTSTLSTPRPTRPPARPSGCTRPPPRLRRRAPRQARPAEEADGARGGDQAYRGPDCWVGLNSTSGQSIYQGLVRPVDQDVEREAPGFAGDRQPARHHADSERQDPEAERGPGGPPQHQPSSKTPVQSADRRVEVGDPLGALG